LDYFRLVDLGRKENITEIDTSKVVKPVIIDILNEIKVIFINFINRYINLLGLKKFFSLKINSMN
jgi:hypothetical protein